MKFRNSLNNTLSHHREDNGNTRYDGSKSAYMIEFFSLGETVRMTDAKPVL
jgi:hypothetical protein